MEERDNMNSGRNEEDVMGQRDTADLGGNEGGVMMKQKISISDKWWFRAIITTLISAVISTLVVWCFNALKPADPQVKAALMQIEHFKTATQKDTLFIELAKGLTGKTDEQTVEKVKKDVLAYLSRAMEKYPTREEFAREKHRFIDKGAGVVWETKVENGNLSMYPVAAYTNKTDSVK